MCSVIKIPWLRPASSSCFPSSCWFGSDKKWQTITNRLHEVGLLFKAGGEVLCENWNTEDESRRKCCFISAVSAKTVQRPISQDQWEPWWETGSHTYMSSVKTFDSGLVDCDQCYLEDRCTCIRLHRWWWLFVTLQQVFCIFFCCSALTVVVLGLKTRSGSIWFLQNAFECRCVKEVQQTHLAQCRMNLWCLWTEIFTKTV